MARTTTQHKKVMVETAKRQKIRRRRHTKKLHGPLSTKQKSCTPRVGDRHPKSRADARRRRTKKVAWRAAFVRIDRRLPRRLPPEPLRRLLEPSSSPSAYDCPSPCERPAEPPSAAPRAIPSLTPATYAKTCARSSSLTALAPAEVHVVEVAALQHALRQSGADVVAVRDE